MSSANSGNWTHIRIRKDTWSRLRQLAAKLDEGYAKGRHQEGPGEQGYSADQLLSWLLDQEDNHAERNRRASLKRADERRALKALARDGAMEQRAIETFVEFSGGLGGTTCGQSFTPGSSGLPSSDMPCPGSCGGQQDTESNGSGERGVSC